jgi:hypothetical protein
LETYSEYCEGAVRDPAVIAAVESHLGQCLRCRRLVRVMTRGLQVLRSATEDVEPSPRFRANLQRRLRAEVAIGDPLAPTHAGLAAALLLAAALGLLVYEGIARRAAASPIAAEAAPPFRPALSNVTLPAFTHSALEFHGGHAPLGSYVLFTQ